MRNVKVILSGAVLFVLIGMGVAGALAEPAASPSNVPAPQVTEDPNPPAPPSNPVDNPIVSDSGTTTTSPVVSTSTGPVLANLGADGIIYTDRGNIIIYGVDSNSRGFVALVVSAAEIASVSAKPDKNTLITRDGIYAVYRLSTGELQVNVGPVAGGEVFEVVFESTGTNKARVTSFGGSS